MKSIIWSCSFAVMAVFVLAGCSDEGVLGPLDEGKNIDALNPDIPVIEMSLEDRVSSLVGQVAALSSDRSTCRMPDPGAISQQYAVLETQYYDLPLAAEAGIGVQSIDEVLEEYETFNAAAQSFVEEVFQDCQEILGIQNEIGQVLEDFPQLTMEELNSRLQVGIQRATNCEELCAASALAWIASIEATFVAGMIGCGLSGPLYPICAGSVLAAKTFALAGVGIDLAKCLEDCKDEEESARLHPGTDTIEVYGS